MRRWLPLADSILRMVVRNMPNPYEAQKARVSTLLMPKPFQISFAPEKDDNEVNIETAEHQLKQKIYSEVQRTTESIQSCSSSEKDPLVIFISKMMTVRVADLTKEDIAMLNEQRQQRYECNDVPYIPLKTDDEVFMALGRIFSGKISRKMSSPLCILNRDHDPLAIMNKLVTVQGTETGEITTEAVNNENRKKNEEEIQHILTTSNPSDFVPSVALSTMTHITPFTDKAIGEKFHQLGCYLLLGPSVFPADDVSAGNIVGIVGLEDHILKTCTITDHWMNFPLKTMTFQSKPMLKVAIEPISHRDLKAIEKGLQLLYQYDPAVEIGMEDNGQHTMSCLGELHLELCVKALIERFAKCEIKVSEPLVSFRETILPSFLENSTVTSSSSSSTSYSEQDNASSPTRAAVSAASHIPPPWSDITGIHRAHNGIIRMVLDSHNLAVTLQAAPFPVLSANLLERDLSLVNSFDEFLNHCYSHLTSAPSSSDFNNSPLSTRISSYLTKNKECQLLWERFIKSFDSKDEENPDFSVPSSILTGNEEELIAMCAELMNPPEIRVQYLSFLLAACGYESYEEFKEKFLSSLLSVGPKSCPTNVLTFSKDCKLIITDSPISDSLSSFSSVIGEIKRSDNHNQEVEYLFYKIWNRLHHSVIVGFREAVNSGLLMNEPMFGIGFTIKKIEILSSVIENILTEDEQKLVFTVSNAEKDDQENSVSESITSSVISSGQLISGMKDSLKLLCLSLPCRIVEPIYQCNLQCDQQQLGNLYAVLSRRRGNVYKEDIIEGTSMFLLSSYLPIAQSFQFTSELLKKTSGAGTAPQLSFSHWKMIGQDPFWKPRTEEEKEEFGDLAFNEHNVAKGYINQIRKRKGLPIDEQIVVFADKQRTLSKKK
jgi:ribosome assembly protein 1